MPKLGTRQRSFISGNICFEIPVQCDLLEADENLSDGGLTWLKGGEFEKGCALLYYSASKCDLENTLVV
jgi:hypothetical protein